MAKAGVEPIPADERVSETIKTSRYRDGHPPHQTPWKHDRTTLPPSADLPRWQRVQVGWEKDVPDFTDPQAPAVIKYREKAERKMREQVPKMIPQLLREYFDFDPMPFHRRFIEDLFKGGKMGRCFPSDHGKSLCSSFWFPILSLMNDPNEAHIVTGANINDSKRRLQAIQMELTTNAHLLRDYPWVGMPKARQNRQWSKQELTVVGRDTNKPNPSVYAAAVGSSDIRGRRGKLILDDTEGQDHRNSPTKRQQLYDFIKLEAFRCYEDIHETSRPVLCAVGTPFDPDSIYFKLRDEGWEFEFLPYKYPNGKLIWPAKAAKIEEFRKSLTRTQFAITMEMDPTGGNAAILTFEDIKRLTGGAAAAEGEKVATMVSLDPASGSTNRRADYAGISVVRVQWDDGWELPLVDVERAYQFTEGAVEQTHFCADLAKEYGCPVMYEANSQQGGTYSSLFSHISPDTPLLRHYTTQANKMDKHMGLSVLKTLVKEGRLRVDGVRVAEDEGMQQFLRELRDLGSSYHDHISASVWFVVLWAYKQHRAARRPNVVSLFARPPRSGYGGLRRGAAPYRRFGR